ncbi:MAG: TssQ family T6SS-associated lipoprotein, partial [Burkholderiaceae bacterium]|nr:TssQ family T6SS-associated lipoprotein [Burkholderiaceae bacterium]
ASSIDVANTSQYTTVVERIFAEGLDFYDKGEYESAIKKFQSPRLVNASWPELRIRTLKYLAFSYCLTNELNACQQAFYDAMQLNPQFKLLPSEEGHPIWGPIYQKARLGPPENTNRFPHSRTTAKKRSKAREQARKADAQPPIQKD